MSTVQVFDQIAEEVVYFVVLADGSEAEFDWLSTDCSVALEPAFAVVGWFVVGMVAFDGTVVVVDGAVADC